MPVCWVYQWNRYTVFRMDIKDRATARKKFEIVYGFHGSDEGTLKKIVQQGTVAAAARPQDGHIKDYSDDWIGGLQISMPA